MLCDNNFFLYFAAPNNIPCLVVVDISADQNPLNLEMKVLTVVTIKCIAPIANGLGVEPNEADVLEEMQEFILENANRDERGIINKLFSRADPKFCFVGRTTDLGERKLYFYGHEAIPSNIFHNVVAKFNSHSFEVSYIDDPDWSQYKNWLHPGAAMRAILASEAQLAVRKEQGDITGVPRLVDHTLFFPDIAGRSAFIERIKPLGWKISMTETATSRGDWGVTVSTEHDVDKLDTDVYIVALSKCAKKFGGMYDGWGAYIVDLKSEKAL
jgi:hypothetical protein